MQLCEGCELLGRHDWRPDHVRIRKMGTVPAGYPPGAAQPAVFMVHPTSGRNGFLPSAPQEKQPMMFGMAHVTSGRAGGFAPLPGAGQPAFTTDAPPTYPFGQPFAPGAQPGSF